MNLVFDPRVEDDLAEAAAFYESRSEGWEKTSSPNSGRPSTRS
jgi:hypothetical protein